MSRSQNNPTWPFLAVLALLFVLSVATPRGWEEVARRQTIDATLAQSPHQGRDSVERQSRQTTSRMSGVPTLAPPIIGEVSQRTQPVLAIPQQAVAHEIAAPAPSTWPESRELPTLAPKAVALAAPDGARGAAALASSWNQRRIAEAVEAYLDLPRLALVPTRIRTRAEGAAGDTAWSTAIAAPDAPHPVLAPRALDEHDGRSSEKRQVLPLGSCGNGWFEAPCSLVAQLDALSTECECGEWALRVAGRVGDLGRTAEPSSEHASHLLDELRSLAAEAESIATTAADDNVVIQLRGAAHALVRRLDVWQSIAAATGDRALIASPDHDELWRRVNDSLALVASSSAGQSVRDYLLLESLREMAAGRLAGASDDPQALARRVLARLARMPIDVERRSLVEAEALAGLSTELRAWAAAPIDPRSLLACVERFEDSRSTSDARRLAIACRHVAYSPLEAEQDLARHLQGHYRNANLRLAVTDDLINCFVPSIENQRQPVRETILGLPTVGWSDTDSRVSVRLVPDASRLRWTLTADGLVAADTRTRSGPVTVFTHANSTFRAERLLEFGPRGIQAGPVSVSAAVDPRLRGIRTDLDGVPLLGAIVRDIALREHRERAPQAEAESRRKIERQIKQRVEEQTAEAIERAGAEVQTRLVEPLSRLGLKPEMIEMRTSDERLTMRVRLAADEQLAGHAPRPAAPADSVLSVQVHQSLINNICERLDLNGRSMSMREFQERVSAALGIDDRSAVEQAPEDLKIKFAAENGITVRCEEDRIAIVLEVAELKQNLVSWKDLTVRVFYRLDGDGLTAKLVRDGTVQMSSPRRLGLHSQVLLRGLFSRIFPADGTIDVIPPVVTHHPRLSRFQVTQIEIREGWVGFAIGPKRQPGVPLVAQRH